MASRRPTPPLDGRDEKIIAFLRADAWLSYAEISRRVHLSASAVQRRVERLMAAGIILGAEARLAPNAARRGLTLYVLVELADDRAGTIRQFSTRMAKVGAVVQSHYVTGEADVVLTMDFANIEEYAAFVERHLNNSRLVRRFKTLTSIRRLK
ncbi:MAG: Lrp/AsnC family transcriptional regulator [Alphaproteobacteria bacterium]